MRCRAAGLAEGPWSALAVLRAARLVRGTGKRGRTRSRPITIASGRPWWPTWRRRTSPSITCGWRGGTRPRAGPIPRSSADHFRKAGRPELAGEYYATAADRAAEALAFDHAATLYRRALELRPPDGGPEPALLTAWGTPWPMPAEAAEAAERYLAAAEGAPPSQAYELRRRGATQLLIGGEIDAGIDALDGVLRDVGLRLPTTACAGP